MKKRSYLGGEIVEGWSKRKLSLAQWALFNQDLKLIKIIGLPQIIMISFKDYYYDWRGSLFQMFWPAGKEQAPWKSMWGPIECPQSQNSKDCWLFIGVRACCWLTLCEKWEVRTMVDIAVGIGMCLTRKCSTWLLYYMHLLSLLQLHSRRKRESNFDISLH